MPRQEPQPLRPQQVHVPLSRRIYLSLLARWYRFRSDIHEPRYVDGFNDGYNHACENYDDLLMHASLVIGAHRTGVISQLDRAVNALDAAIHEPKHTHILPFDRDPRDQP